MERHGRERGMGGAFFGTVAGLRDSAVRRQAATGHYDRERRRDDQVFHSLHPGVALPASVAATLFKSWRIARILLCELRRLSPRPALPSGRGQDLGHTGEERITIARRTRDAT